MAYGAIAGGRAGHTLAEATVSLLLAAVLTVALASLFALIGRAARAHAELASHTETETTVATVLGEELRAATAGDARFSGDSVRLRAFRGGGRVCAVEENRVLVDYAGFRLPEPDKDSVVLVSARGEVVDDVTGVTDAACTVPAQRRGLALTLAHGAPADAAYALVFETGAYSLRTSALRYRRGASGRQPLTEETLDSRGSAIGVRPPRPGGSGAAVVTLVPAAAPGGPALRWSISMPQGGIVPVLAP